MIQPLQTAKFTRGETSVEFSYNIQNMFAQLDDFNKVYGDDAMDRLTKYCIYHDSHSQARSFVAAAINDALETGVLQEDMEVEQLEAFIEELDIQISFGAKIQKPTKDDVTKAEAAFNRLDEILTAKLDKLADKHGMKQNGDWTKNSIAKLIQTHRLWITKQGPLADFE